MSAKPPEGKRAGGRKLQEMKDALDDEKDELLRWEGGLSGWQEPVSTRRRMAPHRRNVAEEVWMQKR